MRLFKIARYNQAILSFDRAVALKPDMVEGYMMRGKSYVGESKPEEALPNFSKAIELRPTDPEAWGRTRRGVFGTQQLPGGDRGRDQGHRRELCAGLRLCAARRGDS